MKDLPKDNLLGYTTCPYNCWPINCGMMVKQGDGGRLSITGNPFHDFSRGKLCVKGQSCYEIADNPHRLKAPMIRDSKTGNFREVSWNTALDRIGTKISENIADGKREATALYHSHGNIVQRINWKILTPRFANMVGITLWDGNFPCWYDVGVGQHLSGYWGLHDPKETCENASALVNWAQDPCASQANMAPYILEMRKRDAPVVTIDPRVTQTAAISDFHIQPRLGTDVWLANAVAHILIRERAYDEDYVNRYCSGFEQYQKHILKFSPAEASRICRVSLAEIDRLADIFVTRKPLAMNLTRGALGKHRNGIQMVRAILCLIPLSGNVGIKGGGAVWGEAIDFNQALCESEKKPEAPYPVNNFSVIDTALESRKVNTLLVVGGNPLSQWPNLPRVRQQLKNLELVVVYDLFLNHTAREAADIVLPATCWLEELGIRTSNKRIYLMEKILSPPGECREASDWMNALANRVGIPDYFPWEDKEACIDECLESDACGGANVRKLRQHPEGIAASIPDIPYGNHVFDSPSGKFEFYATLAEGFGLPPLPSYQSPLESVSDTPDIAESFPLQLISARRNTHFHSFHDSHRVISTLRSLEPGPVLFVHPVDAARRGLNDGSRAVMYNSRGRGLVSIEVTTEVPPGHVSLNDCWPQLNEVTASYTPCPPEVTASLGCGGQPSYQNVLVEVEKQ